MILDKKGKLFGKVSIVDIAIIIIAILAVLVVASKVAQPIKSGGEKSDTVSYTAQIKKIRDASYNAINIGDDLYDKESGAYIGKVVDKKKELAKDIIKKADGSYAEAEIPERYDMTLSIEATGRKTDVGFYMDGKKELLKNADIDFVNENIAFSGTVQSIGK